MSLRGVCTIIMSAALLALSPAAAHAATAIGSMAVQPQMDSNSAGAAEAFKATAVASGQVTTLQIYVDSLSQATRLVAGIYADNSGHPGALLAQGSRTTVAPTAWNQVDLGAGAALTAGTAYWISVLSPSGAGTLRFRDAPATTVQSETSSNRSLSTLPTTWATGSTYRDGNLSAYGTTGTTAPPVLAVAPSSLTFAGTTGAASPASKTLSVTNTGGGALSFSTGSNASWLSVTPGSGSAPATLSVTAATGSLSAGTYTGNVTVTAAGVSGSPSTIPVTFTVTDPPPPSSGDWLQIEHDAARTGEAADETTITTANVGSLSTAWNADLDGKVTAQPLFVGGVTVAGQSKDVVIAATNANSVYAVDAATGATLWRRNLGSVANNCAIPGGYGIGAPGAIDRARGRLYVVADGGQLRTLSLSDGTDAAASVALITNPATNKVWGGLTLVGSSLYVSTASDGCDTPPWRGVVDRVDVSGATPALLTSWAVIPGIAAPSGGGGIWGYGGVSADSATGRVYAATAADSNEEYQLYGDRLVALDASLSVLGSWEPTHPAPGSYPCNGDPCDVDFGATPVVFKPSGCPTMVAAGNKDGNLYISSAATLAAGGPPEQTIRLNPANDYLGGGGVGGVPAYWAAGRKLFVSDAGPGFGGIAAGVVALSIDAQCTASVAWSRGVGAGGSPNSTPTIANGVVYVGEGGSGIFRAFDAQTGTPLWNSGSVGAAAYASPIVARGTVFGGTWSGFSTGSAGRLTAFRVGAQPPPPPPPGGVLLGDQSVEPAVDHVPLGQAEAFQATATASGTLTRTRVYIDSSSNAAKLIVGIYADAGTHPGALIAQGSTTAITPGTFTEVPFTGGSIAAGTRYWIAVLGTTSGTLRFRDASGGCKSETSSQTSLTAMPATWSTGTVYSDCPLSAYGVG